MGCFFMKINKTDRALQIYNSTNQNRMVKNKTIFGKDEIKISEKAAEIQFAINKLKEVPELRMDKINKLKEEIKSGNYKVEGKKIVEKMYENIKFDKRI